ncbi:Epidermal growth factor-related protein 1 [Heterostelium album PN500]|uniref:Epidermal growth factor-related protein 1 n=1 Tax=Heterostelium pallidum (strain ATCC 26659 / Pp 5 / PN500) TaxID=670386 RepID=D3B1Q2_HETP5|nr:Epidermal growth factor-related protein 1 [Heterostelium album PN500]EFA85226.1 Epidermal growth factor-related protein 1 [Heterostelium album PN500]|eukprot:XP_020437335.1 Epidermal growth factor-related protein 1 [Heterostelium album PN500]
MIKILIFIILSLFYLFGTNAQQIEAQQLNSLRWLIRFYQSDWSLTETDCLKIIPPNNAGSIICGVNGTEQYISSIHIGPIYKTDSGDPVNFDLYFPSLNSLTISTGTGGFTNRNNNTSILDLLDNPNQKVLERIDAFTVVINFSNGPCELFVSQAVHDQVALITTSCHILPENGDTFTFNSAQFPKLNSLNADGGPNKNMILDFQNVSKLRFVTLCRIYSYTPMDLTNLPNLGFVENLNIEFVLSGNGLQGQIPDYPNLWLDKVDMSNNPDLSGSIPNSFCSANQISFLNTTITKLPDCLKCLNGNYSFTNNIKLPSSVEIEPNFECNPKLDNNNFIMTASNTSIYITGVNLGYFVANDVSPKINFKMIRANTVFKYTPLSSNGSTTLVFSAFRNISFPISWVSDKTVVESAEVTKYNLTHLELYIGGQFNQNALFSIVDSTDQNCIINIFGPNIIRCVLTLSSPLRTNNIFITLISPYLRFDRILPVKTYPVVSSYSEINTNGGYLLVNGYFGLSPANSKLVISGQECTNINITSSFWECNTGQLSQGLSNVTIQISNFSFPMPQIFVNPFNRPIQCGLGDRCSGNGQCVNGKCICNIGFFGYYCESRLYEGGVINPNSTAPVTSITANGYDFSFNMVGIQEVDDLGSVVKELITSKWNFTSYIFNDTQYLNYTITTSDNINILALIQHSNISRVLSFANQTFTLPPGALKLSVDINNWNYYNNINKLRVVFSTKLEEQDFIECEEIDPINYSQLDNSINYLKIIKNGLSFYGKFMPVSISDGRPTYSKNEILNKTDSGLVNIGINLPQCIQCSIDPDFSLLIQDKGDSCNKKTKTWVIAVATVASVIGVALLFIAGFYIRKYRRNIKLKVQIAMEKLGGETKK